jgi:poly(3-hydroxybutyrate) depolymerase
MTNSHGFVVVAIQYKLGAFGFLSSSEISQYGVPNARLYDVHFSLEWVQKYIQKFGGDPSRVTISGESAGGGDAAGNGILSVVVLGGFGHYVSCPNAVSSRVIHLVFHRLQHLSFSSLDSINMVYQHPSSA